MTYQREFEKRLNIAVVGVGKHAYRNILPTLTYLPVSLRAVCDLDLDLAERTANQYGVKNFYSDTREMYQSEELDAVLLCVSQKQHPTLACEAFDEGLHVWMEKPPATRASQVQRMIQHRRDKICVVGFKKAFMPSTQKVIEIFSMPNYGPVQNMLGVYPIPKIPEDGRAVLEEERSTGWLKNGCHPLALMLTVGGHVKSVILHQGQLLGAICILQFENGCIGNLHLVDGANKTQPIERYMFVGDNCHVEIENNLRVTFQRGIPFDYATQTSYLADGLDSGAIVWEPQNHLSTLENRAEFTQGIYGELRYFCDRALNGQPAELGSLEVALEVMKVYEAALLSNGNWIETADICTTS